MTEIAAGGDVPLVGRQEELAAILRVLESAGAGSPRLLLLAGEPGVGKSRLAREALDRALSRGWRVLAGKCLEGILVPYTPVHEALKGGGLEHLMEFGRSPRVEHAVLLSRGGSPLATAHRAGGELDDHALGGMVAAVNEFVRDSVARLATTDEPAPRGSPSATAAGPSIIGYAGFRILVETRPAAIMAVVLTGQETELLKDDLASTMDRILTVAGPLLPPAGTPAGPAAGGRDPALDAVLRREVEQFITSGRYDGLDEVTEPETRYRRLVANVTRGLARVARETPLLLFLDDLHWCDPSTLALVVHLLQRLADLRFAVLAAYRPAEIEKPPDLRTGQSPLAESLELLRKDDLVQEIAVGRLERGDVQRLLEEEIGALADGSLGDALAAAAGGLPFIVRESVALLRERGSIVLDPALGWSLAAPVEKLGIPSRVRDAVRHRIHRLPQEQRDALETGAVLGEAFAPSPVACLLGTTVLAAHRALRELELRHGLVRTIDEGARYRFDHPMVRESIYENLPRSFREEMHRHAVPCLVKVDGPQASHAGEIAYHADAGGHPDALRLLRAAGDGARAEFQNAEAVRFYLRALDRAGGEDRLQILESLGDVLHAAGRSSEAIPWYRQALAGASAPDHRTLLAAKTARALDPSGRIVELREVLLQNAPAEGAAGEPAGQWHTARSWLAIRELDFDVARREAELALLCFGDAANEGRVGARHLLGVVAFYLGMWEDARVHWTAAVEESRLHRLHQWRLRSAISLAMVYECQGRLPEGEALVNETLADADRMGFGFILARCLRLRGHFERVRGNPAAAEETLTQSMRLFGELGSRAYLDETQSFRGQCRLDLGKLAEAEADARESRRLAGDHPEDSAWAELVLADVLTGCGKAAEAVSHARRAVEQFAAGTSPHRRAISRLYLAHALAAEATPAGRDEALRLFGEIDGDGWQRIEAWDWALGLFWWGEALAAAGRTAEARPRFADSRTRFMVLGSTHAIRWVDQALDRLGR